jgi:hypothetical protein
MGGRSLSGNPLLQLLKNSSPKVEKVLRTDNGGSLLCSESTAITSRLFANTITLPVSNTDLHLPSASVCRIDLT